MSRTLLQTINYRAIKGERGINGGTIMVNKEDLYNKKIRLKTEWERELFHKRMKRLGFIQVQDLRAGLSKKHVSICTGEPTWFYTTEHCYLGKSENHIELKDLFTDCKIRVNNEHESKLIQEKQFLSRVHEVLMTK